MIRAHRVHIGGQIRVRQFQPVIDDRDSHALPLILVPHILHLDVDPLAALSLAGVFQMPLLIIKRIIGRVCRLHRTLQKWCH